MSDTVVKSNESILSLTNHRPPVHPYDDDDPMSQQGGVSPHRSTGDVLAAIDKSDVHDGDDDDVGEDLPPLPPLPPPSPIVS